MGGGGGEGGIARAEFGEFQPGRLSLVHTCRKNRGWLLLDDVIE